MRKSFFLATLFLFFLLLTNCHKKELIEIVEVPLPSAEQKISIGNPEDVVADEGSFQLESLPYKYDALAPTISALALELHYSKHYLNYTNSLNKLTKETPFDNLTIEELLATISTNDTDIRNSAGGYYNHSLFFKIMSPKAGRVLKDTLAGAINKDFGSFANFTNQFKNAATNLFGSGWVWLVVNSEGKLIISSTQNQDNPLMAKIPIEGTKGQPILGIDIWEHAYYIDYQNKRKNYIDAFFNVINWEVVNDNYKDTF